MSEPKLILTITRTDDETTRVDLHGEDGVQTVDAVFDATGIEREIIRNAIDVIVRLASEAL